MKSPIGISPQAIKVYRLLLKKKELTAKEIGHSLNIFPNAVYRLMDELEKVGFLEKKNLYPKRFRVRSLNEAWDNFFLFSKNKFDKMFSDINVEEEKKEDYYKEFSISFITKREALFDQFIEDLSHTKKEAKFIVLGLSIGISPELLLAEKQAIEKGIKIKEIIQEYTEENQKTIESWLKIGVNLRIGNPIGFHLLLFDDTISYIVLYQPKNKIVRYGVRIIHKGINYQLQDIFNKCWGKAKQLDKL